MTAKQAVRLRETNSDYYTHCKCADKLGVLAAAVIGLLCTAPISAQQISEPGRQALRNELHNVQAMAYGYVATCESGDLKMKRPGSATFVIRSSRLCLGWRGARAAEQDDSFTLCSTDPARHVDAVVGKCAALREHAFVPLTAL